MIATFMEEKIDRWAVEGDHYLALFVLPAGEFMDLFGEDENQRHW